MFIAAYEQGYLNVGVVKSRSKEQENPDATFVRDDDWPSSEQGQQSVPEHGVRLYAETITWAPKENVSHTGYRPVNQVRFLMKKVKFCMKLKFCKLLRSLPLLSVRLDPSAVLREQKVLQKSRPLNKECC